MLNQRTKDRLEEYVDVCAGKMTLEEVGKEIIHYMLKSPENMIVTIERNDEVKGYYSTIYISKKDFEEKC